MLLASGAGAAEDIERAAQEAHGLGLFVRRLVGLDEQAAVEVIVDIASRAGLLRLFGACRPQQPCARDADRLAYRA